MTITLRATIRAGVVLAACAAAAALAQPDGEAEAIDWLALAMGMIGGLALFLYGVDLLATSLRQAHGGRFHRLLERSSSNRVAALASGTAATVALDSSSVTIILLVTLSLIHI